MLQFYQEMNPSQIVHVDKLLTEYRGAEELLKN